MSNKILIKRGSGAPTTSDLDNYEIAYDTGANKLYIRDGSDIIPFAAIVDEDNFASDDANRVPSQQSTKAYIASELAAAGAGDITAVVAGTGLSGGSTSGEATLNVSGLTVSELAANSLTTSSESFADNDTTLMTSAAINDRITSFNYLTAHPNISAASSSDNSGRTYIQDITVDSNGHVTGIATATETVTNTDTNTVTTNIAGTGVSVSSGTGNSTISIGQSVGTSDTVAFGRVNLGSTNNSTFLSGDSLLTADGYIMVQGIVNESETGGTPAAITFGNGATLGNDQISLITSGNTRIHLNSSGVMTFNGTVAGTAIKDQDDMSSNSATHLATQQSIKAYVDAEVAGIVNSAPSALNTLDELAAALGDDANFATTTSTSLGNRLRVDTASQGLTGTQQANAITNLGITATKAELNYVDGVTSNIQTQLDATLDTAGTGIDISSTTISVDVSDFMSNGSNDRILTATGTDAMNAEANLTFSDSSNYLTVHEAGASTGSHLRLATDNSDFFLSASGSSNQLTIYDANAATNSLVMGSDGKITLRDSLKIPVGKSVFFGGSEHTYIREDIDDRLRFFVGGAEFMRFTEDTSDTINLYQNVSMSGSMTLDSVAVSAIQTSSESFADNNTSLMTSAAINDRIESFGYITSDTTLSTEQVQDIAGGMFSSNTETGIAATYQDGDGTIDLVVDYLPATDDRDVKPNAITTSGAKQVRAYFTSLGGLTGSENSDYQDLLVLDTYSDGTGGDMNALAFDKSTQNIYHYLADQSDSTWGTAKRIAYIENGSNNRVMTASSSSTVNGEGNLTFDGTNLTVAHSSGAVIFAASHATDKIQLYSGGNEKIGTEANTIVFTADNYKFKDVAGTTNLTLDNNGVAYLTSHLDMGDGDRIKLGDSDDLQLVHTGGINYIHSTSSNTDLYIRVNDDGTDTDAIIIDSSDNAQVRLPNDNQYLTFGAGGDGVLYSYNDDFYVSNHTAGNDILLTCLNSAGDTHNTIMFVDGSAQRVGINTTSPATEFHVNASGANGMVLKASDNASNSARLFFDGTATSCIFQEGNDLSFRTGATTASSSGTERFFITSSGPKVPTGSQLYVDDIYGQSNGTNRLVLDDDTNSAVANGVSLTGVNHVYLCPDETNNGTGEVRVITGTDNDLDSGTADAVAKITNAGEAHFKGDVVAFSSSPSDRQLKENISTIENGLDKVMKLRGVEFDWTATSRKGQHDIGLIAQEVEEVLPEVVSVKTLRVGEFGRDGDEKDFKTVNYEKMVGVLVEAIKELKAEIEELKK